MKCEFTTVRLLPLQFRPLIGVFHVLSFREYAFVTQSSIWLTLSELWT